jgi:hypothetical protein
VLLNIAVKYQIIPAGAGLYEYILGLLNGALIIGIIGAAFIISGINRGTGIEPAGGLLQALRGRVNKNRREESDNA